MLAAALVFTAPAFAQPSPENTTVPPAPFIRDRGGHVWKLGAPGSPPVTPNTIDTKVLIYCNHRVYAQGRLDGLWYRGTPGAGWIFQEGRASWTLIGAIIPCT